MRLSQKIRCAIAVNCLLLSACTETIIREVPASVDATTPETSALEPLVSEPGIENPVATAESANMVAVTPDSNTGQVVVAATNNMVATNPASGVSPTAATDEPGMVSVVQPAGSEPDPASTDTTSSVSSPTVVSGTGALLQDPVTGAADPAIPDTAVATSGFQLQDPDTAMTVGEPGTNVDCAKTLPCRWISADAQFSLTVTNADNIATRARLSVNYSITTAHDTEIFVSRADNAVDSTGLIFKATDQVLGGGNGGTPQGVIAGSELTGTLNFDTGTTSDTISTWSIAFLDGGMLRLPTFSNIPVGTITTAQADCQNTLPCVWATPINDVAITLHSVGGISLSSRLTANFSIETATNMAVAVDEGSIAHGTDGTTFEGRTHTLVSDTNYLKVSGSATAGIPVYGSINFYRTESVPTSLQLVSLVIYQDQPVPRWNPQFINVPIQ